jgi:hypothetical protein
LNVTVVTPAGIVHVWVEPVALKEAEPCGTGAFQKLYGNGVATAIAADMNNAVR